MLLDRPDSLVYPDSDTAPGYPAPGREEVATVIVFLSFPNSEPRYDRVAEILRRRGFTVLTNFDRTNLEDAERKTDLRLARIRRSRAFVFFAEEVDGVAESVIRQTEYGYALGCGLSMAYVGHPYNSLHRYGDVFEDVEEFVARWYSPEYLQLVSQWFPNEIRVAS